MVEDDLRSAELIRMQLEAEGFEVIHAPSAEAALELALQHPLSLITLDINLPAMDGWEFLARIKQVPDLMHVPVVIISIVADRAKGFALGASAVLHKPMSRQELSDSLVGLGMFPLANSQPLRILIVDDDPEAVELVAVHATALGGVVLRAYGGLEAISTAREQVPDLIVLDLLMPAVTGFDVVVALSQHAATARIPIVIVTSSQLTAEHRASLHGAVATILEKTQLNHDRFTSEVRRAMSGRRLEA